MSKFRLNPQSPIDELPGLITGSIAQLTDSIDKAQNHYQVFQDLGLNPENIASAEAQKKMRLMHKTLRPEFHPDKVFQKLQGGETEAEISALRNQMEERFKKLQAAYEVLSDADKRAKYNQMLDHRVVFRFEEPQPEKDKSPESPSSVFGQRYQALVPLEDIEAFYKNFIKDFLPEGMDPETAGFSVSYRSDPKTGERILEVSFPNQELGAQFIQQLAQLKMIDYPFQQMTAAATQSPAPTPQKEEPEARDEGYRLPQLKPQLRLEPNRDETQEA